jgi:hypothetical protein
MIIMNKVIKNHISKFEMIYKYQLKNYNNYDKYYYILDIIDHLSLNNCYFII